MSGKGKGKSRYDGKGALAKQAKATKSAAAMPASASQEIVEPELETGAMIADAAMPIQHCHTLTLTIRAPFLFPGVAAGWFGVDRVALRDHKGQIIIPQDQVRGVLRDGLRLLGYVDLVKDLFGYGSAASDEVNQNYDPHRGKIFLSDLVASGVSATSREWHHRVRIDPESGAADEGHLLVDEQIAPAGTDVNFTGQFSFFALVTDAPGILAKLKAALRVPLCIGAMKTVGFGEIVGVTVTHRPFKPGKVLAASKRYIWSFTIDRPYLVDAQRIADNAYLGSVDLPGAALKGLIAHNLHLRGVDLKEQELAAALSSMQVGFGRQKGSGGVFPASVVLDRTKPARLVDLAVDGTSATEPELQADWKDADWKAVRKTLGPGRDADVAVDERVHTAINEQTGGALDQKLFSTLARVPDQNFSAALDLTGLADGPRSQILDVLGQDLVGLGRTGAIVQGSELTVAATLPEPKAGRIVLLLKTRGLLAVPSDAGTADAAYRAFWKVKLPNSSMTRHYASQTLVGGYVGQRFRTTRQYQPWMVTDAGAVFVLELHSGDVASLRVLLQRGVCRSELNAKPLTWQNCPFVAENGFGEMALHQPHQARKV